MIGRTAIGNVNCMTIGGHLTTGAFEPSWQVRVRKQLMEEDMLTKRLALAFLGTALISASAAAQTQPSGSAAPSSGQMSTTNWMTQEQPGQWRASKLEGLN